MREGWGGRNEGEGWGGGEGERSGMGGWILSV